MKKVLCFILIVLVSLIIPNVNAKDDVSIESIRLIDTSEQTTELSNPTKNGLKIGFDLSFSSLEDYAKYEVVVNNDSNKEYEIKDETKFSSSNYIEYKYEFKEKNNRIKAKSKATLYITITYKNSVPGDKLTDGKYIENNEMAISLSNEENPKTFSSILYILLFIILILIFTFIINNKNLKNISIVIIVLLLVPVTIFALEKLRLDVSTKITIEKKYMVSYRIDDVLIKESEMNNYRIQKDSNGIEMCRDYLVIINNVKYKYCDIDVREYHTAGERVNVNLEVNIFKKYYYDETTGESKELCSFENNVYICPEQSLEKDNDILFEYGKLNHMTAEGFITYDNDLEVMKFLGFESATWNIFNAFPFSSPISFTMPEHNVLFTGPSLI